MVKRQFFAGFAEYNSHSLENTERERTTVAPHAGAWIETLPSEVTAAIKRSPPMRGRGLKLIPAWRLFIEMKVAPHAGAWIETYRRMGVRLLSRSPPMRGRGLKQDGGGLGDGEVTSPPMRGRGLKPHLSDAVFKPIKSPPMRGRGLKP